MEVKNKKRKGGLFNAIMDGRIFEVFTKNSMLMGLIVLYSFLYVSNRYQHEQEIVRIYKLNKRKNEIRNNLLIVKSEFAYQCRLSEIEKLLTEKGSDFHTLSAPPYLIDKND
ncbi:MAG: hypothetical protein J6Q73_08880 [Bacteroidaceae bacterium]|nr:hypothetical protein [Bacteroidaceae bacterium]